MERAFYLLTKEGLQLDETARGYVAYRQASLTEAQDLKFTTWSKGQFDWKTVVASLRRLDTVVPVKSAGVFLQDVPEDDKEVEVPLTETFTQDSENLDEEESYILVEEGDLDKIYEESEAQMALATYQEVRKAINMQQKNRQYFGGGKGRGPQGKSSGKLAGKFAGRRRVHIEELKLRTKCGRCGLIGHWARECTNPPDQRGLQRGSNSASVASSKAGSSSQSQQSWYVAMGETSGSLQCVSSCFGFSCRGITRKKDWVSSDSSVAIDQESDVGPEVKLSSPLEMTGEPIGLNQRFEPQDILSSGATFFIGLMTNPAYAVVDTAAQDGLIGHQALERLKVQLADLGLQVSWTGRKAKAHGVGGAAKVIGIVAIPLGIGGNTGILEATVVEGEVPLLLPIRMLRQLGAVIDLPALCIHFSHFQRTLPLNVLPSGHVAIEIVDFGEKGFHLESCGEMPYKESDFRNAPLGSISQSNEVMLSHFQSSSSLAHGVEPACCASSAPSAALSRACSSGRPWAGAKFETSSQALEANAGQSDFSPASSWIGGIGALVAASDKRGDSLLHMVLGATRRAHRACRKVATAQDQGGSSEACGRVRAQGREAHEGLESVGSVGDMHGLSLSLGTPDVPKEASKEEEGGSELNREGRECTERGGHHHSSSVEKRVSGASQKRGFPGNSVVRAENLDGPMDRGAAAEGGSGPRDDACRAEEAQGGGRSAERGIGGQRDHDVGVCMHGNGSEVSGAQRLPRCGDACIRPSAFGGAEGSDAAGSSAEGNCEGEQQFSVESGAQRRRVGCDHGPRVGQERVTEDPREEHCHQQEQNPLKVEETWVRLKQHGGVAERLKVLQNKGFFEAKEVFVEFEDGMCSTSVEDLTEEDVECLVKINMNSKVRFEDELEEVEETALPKKLKTQLRAAEKSRQESLEEESFQVDVSEVFSQPRLTTEAERQHLKAGGAYDILTGYDLRRKKDLQRMRQALEKDKPELVACSPPCGPFSPLQRLNFPKMSFAKVMSVVGEGLQHVRTSAQVCRRQYEQGRLFLFEHPRPSKAWEEKELEALKNLPGVHVCNFNMCRYGMRVHKELNKKATTMITNSPEIAENLQLVCEGGHVHETLMGGRAAKAAEYPPALCQAIICGLRKHLRRKHLQAKPPEEFISVLAVEGAEEEQESLGGAEEEDQDEEEEEVARVEEASSRQVEVSVSAEDRVKIRKMHVNLGHPNKASFLRFLRAGRVRQEILQWVAKEFTCGTCQSQAMPKAPRPAVVPRCYAPGVALGLDVFYVPDERNHRSLPVLNLVDLGTSYQMVEVLDSKEPMHIWHTVWKTWARTFGLPQFITVDEGREFRGGLARICADAGVIIFRAAARAPWQQGKVERHGGLMKAMLEKGREELPPTSREELVSLLHACEAAKNRYSNRSGFSPTQRQIGHWPRMPSSLLSDEALDPALQSQGQTDEFERMMEMRRVAQEAFMKLSSREAAAKVLKARPRVQQTYKAGDLVYVFRALRRQKALRHGAIAQPRAQRAKWVGPGHVLATEGSVIWINMLGELWRAATEQVRHATSDERLGVEIISEECEEMQERLKRSSHRAGYRDITNEPWPETAEAIEDQADEVQAEGEIRGRPRPRLEDEGSPETGEGAEAEAQHDLDEEDAASEGAAVPRQGSHQIVLEPEGEIPAASTPAVGGGIAAATEFPNELPVPTDEMARQLVESEAAVRRLDGLPEESFDANRDKVLPRWRRSMQQPYFCEFEVFFQGEAESEEKEEERPKKDYWVFDPHREVVQRHHVAWRKQLFNPAHASGCPVPLRALKKARRTKWLDSAGQSKQMDDEWSLFTEKEERISWWRGITEFSVDAHFLADSPQKAAPKKKRGEGEVFPHEIPAEEWPEWKVQDTEEFKKIVDSGALRILSVEESKQVWARLEAEGKTERVIPSRMVRRYKPGEGPGAPRVKKSRFCIRGDKDPDILSLSRFAPTVTTSNLQVIFQVAANKKFKGLVGDLKSAFTQSRPLQRSEGPLYCKSFHGSMPGLQEGQLAEIILGCYGLVDAPLNWRLTLTDFIQAELGYKQSSLDPCTYLLFDKEEENGEEKLQGVISVEVDDLLMFGGEKHEKKIQKLQERFTFGKMKEIDAQGVDFNGRRLRKVGNDYLIDMQAFVEERLQMVDLTPERKKQKKAEVTEEERSRVRSVCGALNWIGREGRPDAAAAASMFSSLMSTMTIEDVLDLNKAVEQLKADAGLSLRIQPIEESRLRWGVISDASWANAKKGKTQAGHMLIAFDCALLEGQRATTNVLHWRSGKLQRTVSSTLAAETQTLARGVGDLLWMMVVYEELTTASFQIRDWRKYIGRKGYSAFTKFEETEEVKTALALVDAKSLYDLLIHETTGGSDRRNALDVQALREELAELKGQIRWVEHLEMPADCLTKKLGKVTTLKRLLNEGVFGITEESAALGARLNNRKEYGYNKR